MYSKGKSNSSINPCDSHTLLKLALYMYEYLLHVGVQKSPRTFLSEIRWGKKSHWENHQDFYIPGGTTQRGEEASGS
uniref:LisH domain-containing protein n=1 Tax=Theropithecus gelada TaxID=9565 RepID=A0A8D2FHX6_THEGE